MNLTTAIQRMRLLRQTGQDFGLVFYTASEPFGVRKIESCTLRARPVDVDGDKDSKRKKFALTDRFLYFTDLTTGEAKQCRKRLITKMRIGKIWYDVTLE